MVPELKAWQITHSLLAANGHHVSLFLLKQTDKNPLNMKSAYRNHKEMTRLYGENSPLERGVGKGNSAHI